jgi:hypothetical protein
MAAAAAQGAGEDVLAMLDQAHELDRQLENLKISSTVKGENG